MFDWELFAKWYYICWVTLRGEGVFNGSHGGNVDDQGGLVRSIWRLTITFRDRTAEDI